MQNDAELWADAYKQGILLVGPTTLLYIIRIVNVLWQQELQARSVQDVMNRGAELYDKFVGFVSDLEAVGKSLRAAEQNYGLAMKKLSEGRGNLVRQVEMLKQLGVRTSKSTAAQSAGRRDGRRDGVGSCSGGRRERRSERDAENQLMWWVKSLLHKSAPQMQVVRLRLAKKQAKLRSG